MNQDISFMSELFRIVNGALRLDIDKVRNYTAFLADKLEKAGDQASAGRLRKMLEESDQQLRPTGAAFAKVLPVDAESRFPLIERVNLKTLSEPPVVLGQDQLGHGQRVSEHREELRAGRRGGPGHVAESLNVRSAGNGKEPPRALHRAGAG